MTAISRLPLVTLPQSRDENKNRKKKKSFDCGSGDSEEDARGKKILLITDQHSKIFGYRVLNSQLSLYIGVFQLLVCLWALTQHVYSIIKYKKILYCDFENVTLTEENQFLVGVDAIIFDVGLFHSLWGIHGCVAQHLDGGYGRFGWCICHIAVLLFCLPFAFVSRPKPYFLWPLLIQQSAYGIGLLILSLAALPRILPTFMGDLTNAPIFAILFYLFGALMNYWLLYVYYHWYWHVESEYESATKLIHNRLSNDVDEVDPRRRPFRAPQPNSSRFSGGPTTTLQVLPNGTSIAKTNGINDRIQKSPIEYPGFPQMKRPNSREFPGFLQQGRTPSNGSSVISQITKQNSNEFSGFPQQGKNLPNGSSGFSQMPRQNSKEFLGFPQLGKMKGSSSIQNNNIYESVFDPRNSEDIFFQYPVPGSNRKFSTESFASIAQSRYAKFNPGQAEFLGKSSLNSLQVEVPRKSSLNPLQTSKTGTRPPVNPRACSTSPTTRRENTVLSQIQSTAI
ncbi:hypothetical protein FO519_005001 [Halicephalobus sp. NKZ332]|nr:hypothetical protein FO519_005001 [Halicephalobus sp. NKZ332]